MLITTITSIDILNLQVTLPKRIFSNCRIIITARIPHYNCLGCLLTYHEECSTPRTFKGDKLISYCNEKIRCSLTNISKWKSSPNSCILAFTKDFPVGRSLC